MRHALDAFCRASRVGGGARAERRPRTNTAPASPFPRADRERGQCPICETFKAPCGARSIIGSAQRSGITGFQINQGGVRRGF
jgi:hypothetical protein